MRGFSQTGSKGLDGRGFAAAGDLPAIRPKHMTALLNELKLLLSRCKAPLSASARYPLSARNASGGTRARPFGRVSVR